MVKPCKKECIRLNVGSVWYDTVDQPHIPIVVINLCDRDLFLAIEIRTLDSKVIERTLPIKVKKREQRNLEFVVEAPDTYLVICSWKKESDKEWSLMKPIEVKA